MKKLIIVLSIFLLASSCVFADGEAKYSKLYTYRLFLCLPYSGVYNADDGTVYSRRLLSWKDHKCRFYETIKSKDKTENYACLFGRSDLTTLVQSMRKDPNGNIEADALWKKYKENKNICTFSEN